MCVVTQDDKFTFEAKRIDTRLSGSESWEQALTLLTADELEMLQLQMGPDTARLKPDHFIAHLFRNQNAPQFARLFDDTLRDIAHAIGEQRCTLFSQDISQKSSSLLRLNLILNNLVHSIPNIIQGNTLLHPYHKEGKGLKKFDYIVSNPPFKMDFSDFRNELDTPEQHERFFAGVPNVPKQATDKMAIYQLFLQHTM